MYTKNCQFGSALLEKSTNFSIEAFIQQVTNFCVGVVSRYKYHGISGEKEVNTAVFMYQPTQALIPIRTLGYFQLYKL